jgi:hypothetical protein
VSAGGKGSGRRPGDGYDEGYERLWGKKPKPKESDDGNTGDSAEGGICGADGVNALEDSEGGVNL